MSISKSRRRTNRLRSSQVVKKVQSTFFEEQNRSESEGQQLATLKARNTLLKKKLTALRQAAKSTTIVKHVTPKVVIIHESPSKKGSKAPASGPVSGGALLPAISNVGKTRAIIPRTSPMTTASPRMVKAVEIANMQVKSLNKALATANSEINRLRKALALSQSESRRLLESAQQQIADLRQTNAVGLMAAGARGKRFEGFDEVLAIELAAMREGFEAKLEALQKEKDSLKARLRMRKQ